MPTHFKGCEGAIRALNAYITLTRAANTLGADLANQLESEGLTTSQFGTLETLHHLGPLCQHTIAEKLLKSGGNITLVIDNLEKHGWVRRERGKDDRRMVRVHLTPAGRRRIAKILPPHVEAIVKTMGRLTATEQEELRRLCRKLGRGDDIASTAKTTKQKGDSHDSDSTQR
jgi:MarR family transcriptional regulator, 2-MHQ and catechol-resistance regulon repressor